MRIDRVKYTAHYDEYGNVKDQWVGLEAVIDDTESPERQLDAIKKITDQWYKANNPHVQFEGTYIGGHATQQPPVLYSQSEPEIGVTPEVIMSCNDLVTIDSYRLIIKGKGELEAAYVKRRAEIVDAEKKEILNRTGNRTF